jgi:hypothetical protein
VPGGVRQEALAASDRATFGAFAEELVGIVGIGRQPHPKAAHKCEIWGLYAMKHGMGRAVFGIVMGTLGTIVLCAMLLYSVL